MKIRLSASGLPVSSFSIGLRTWDFPRSYRFDSTRVQICGYVQHLLIGHRHCGHALSGRPRRIDFANLVTLHVMSHKRRADKVRPPSTCGIRAMTESTRLLELFVSALELQGLEKQPVAMHGIP